MWSTLAMVQMLWYVGGCVDIQVVMGISTTNGDGVVRWWGISECACLCIFTMVGVGTGGGCVMPQPAWIKTSWD